jgi:phage-related protein
LWTSIKTGVSAAWEWIKNIVVGTWENLKSMAATVWNAIKTAVMTPINALKDLLQGVWDKISGAVKSMAEGIKGFFTNAFTAIGGIIKAPINGVIGVINKAIGAINGISVSIPSWVPLVGGQTFGVNIPLIPTLAKGATILPRTGGTLALLAEAGKAETVVDTGGVNRMIADVNARLDSGDMGSVDYTAIMLVLDRLLAAVEAGHVLEVDTGELVGATKRRTSQALQSMQSDRSGAFGGARLRS